LSLVVDSSVFVAYACEEPEGPGFLKLLQESESNYVAWPSLLETWTVLARRLGVQKTDKMIHNFCALAQAVAFDETHYQLARDAYERFRLNSHPARLNYGDVMSYALARAMDLPLLFKGADFGQTDVKVHPGSILS
jgi:ribonuclease VapC